MRNRTYTVGAKPGDTVTVAGWVHEVRDLGDITFLILRGTSGKIQVESGKDETDDDPVETGLGVHRESIISVAGEVGKESCAPTGAGVTLESLDVIVEVEAQSPLDSSGKVDAELSMRLNNRMLDLRKNKVKAIFEIRAEVRRAAHDKSRDLRATEINTPRIVTTGAESGTELSPIAYFGQEVSMNQSSQLFKQPMVGSGLERVFGISPIFHAEEHNMPHHLGETTSIGFESASIDHTEAMDVCEAVVTATYEVVEENCQDELEALGFEEEFEASFDELPRLTYKEAIRCISAAGELDKQPVWGDDFPTGGEKALGEDIGGHCFVTDWPSEIKPFYTRDHDDDKTFSTGSNMMRPSMELVLGDQREHRFDYLVAGSEQQGLDPDASKYYAKVLKYGMPLHAGFGLDGERLIMTVLGLENIRRAVLSL